MATSKLPKVSKNKLSSLTPKKIVEQLDRFIVGQTKAKKAVAIAIRNRERRALVTSPLREEILPKNILMIGPTGVGKTEISRRISKLSGAPFLKVEATKFTEVGFVGRDVDSIARDLVDIAVLMKREQMRKEVKKKAKVMAEERLLTALVGENASEDTRSKFLNKIQSGEMDDKEVEIDLQDTPASSMTSFDIPGMPGGQMGVLNISDMLSKALGGRMKAKRMKCKDAMKILITEESDKLIDEEKIVKGGLDLAENYGIVFIDEIDKITSGDDSGSRRGAEVSREGVQRDLLPLLEGTTVSTKYGPVKTDHILFICSGAFHMSKPADLLPELQGRLPIRVELDALTQKDLSRILTEPESSLPKQNVALLATEGIQLEFTDDGIETIAAIAADVNRTIENIGARRLYTCMEKLLEEISFDASDTKKKKLVINAKYVKDKLAGLAENSDLSKFIL